MAKLYKLGGDEHPETLYCFTCPGCGYDHPFRTSTHQGRPLWKFNGNLDKPTFKPSLLIWKDVPAKRCHLHVVDGKINYCGDCHHSLAGKSVDMKDIE